MLSKCVCVCVLCYATRNHPAEERAICSLTDLQYEQAAHGNLAPVRMAWVTITNAIDDEDDGHENIETCGNIAYVGPRMRA